MSRISIIIPIYNCAAFVGKTLDSLLTQTYRDIEIICVNDGSTDDSEKVLQQYARRDGRICVFNQPNAGIGKARNTGLDVATGTYIMFCDSDDWYEPNMCTDMVTALEQSRTDVVMCQTCFEFESDSDRHIQSQKRGLTDRYYNPKEICDNLNKSRLSVNCLVWNKIWRKEIIDRYHIRFPEGCNHEDDAFWAIYSFCAEKILYLPQKLYHYFIRSGSIMDDYVNLKMKNRLDRMRSSHFVFDFLKTHNLLQRYSNDMCRIFYRQLKACLHFLTDDEVVEQTTIVNQRLVNDLHTTCFLAYYHHELFLFLKPKNPLILLAGLIWYGLRWCVSSPTRRHKYRRRLLKNMFYLTNSRGGGVMIYLNCEVKSGLGEDTFWTWFEREFPGCSFEEPTILNDDDILIRYSTLGFLPVVGKQVAYCLELYPQMGDFFGLNQWDTVLQKVYQTARYATYRVVATPASIKDYSRFGSVNVIPIGVNTDLYRPMSDKRALRQKYNLPSHREIGIWIGTCHPMKGYDLLLRYAAEHPDIHWIVIWKWEKEALPMQGASNFIQIPQQQIAELINCADFFLSTNKLNSYFMAEWEAMACDIPFRILETTPREFYPSDHPRQDVFQYGWDRLSAKRQWENFLTARGVSW